ncbi:hypothetical protein B5G06_12115 [Flavonifractor sp. An52]|uniref:hypothetical protein n=1 Tax=Flavonifractor sp. An52 TaxID=1965642 RepID=UPI000B3831D4|nr:hypothetical protein [Flavonifractor sp. An52]OUN79935.1 hypothetical protein B5G06_12115 [Flavonifractor sp. An52]
MKTETVMKTTQEGYIENVEFKRGLPPLKPFTLSYNGVSMDSKIYVDVGVMLQLIYAGYSIEEVAHKEGLSVETCKRLLRNKTDYFTIYKGIQEQYKQQAKIRRYKQMLTKNFKCS